MSDKADHPPVTPNLDHLIAGRLLHDANGPVAGDPGEPHWRGRYGFHPETGAELSAPPKQPRETEPAPE